MNRLCFACDLSDDAEAIAKYKKYHMAGYTWAEITSSIKDAGVIDMQIYLVGNRLFMIMDVGQEYSSERKAKMDADNPKVQEWEALMGQFQQAVPLANDGQKWTPMEQIFKL